jgi:hypothetical protein
MAAGYWLEMKQMLILAAVPYKDAVSRRRRFLSPAAAAAFPPPAVALPKRPLAARRELTSVISVVIAESCFFTGQFL